MQLLADRVERGDTLQQARAFLNAAPFGVLDFGVHPLEGLRHRREQVLDGFLARVDVRVGFGTRLLEPRFGELEKRLVVLAERLRAERFERFAEPRFGVLPRLEPLGMQRAFLLELGLQAGLSRTRPSHPTSAPMPRRRGAPLSA